jgi:protein-S-isoprenylcysteine O-methyltransferase Ste14
MYLAELALAFGAAGTLAAPVASALAVLFTGVIVRRIAHEERALVARLPEYRRYAARTYRLVPYVY